MKEINFYKYKMHRYIDYNKINYIHIKVKKVNFDFMVTLTVNQMVFAERGETISGGNFHGEYPAKVFHPTAFSKDINSTSVFILFFSFHTGS